MCLQVCGAESEPHFSVQHYSFAGESLPATNALPGLLLRFTGTNITRQQIGAAAAVLQSEYAKQGLTNISVSVALDQITHGVVLLHVFRTAVPQVLLSGLRYTNSPAQPLIAAHAAPNLTTNATSARTNTGPFFTVRAYEIRGDTLLSTKALSSVLLKYTGTNVSIGDIMKAKTDLQMEYRDRGYATVVVTVPQQHLTNGIVKFQIVEGRLSDILVTGNRYYSSNNVMRALPSLRTNIIINAQIFNAELSRANANQNRTIYPVIGPGPEPGTSELTLQVKDRLPLHAKLEFSNENSPGTPDLRLNASAVYDNLWQLEHSVGVQYGFSPESYRGGSLSFYDRPVVAYYSAFYRLPLANPEPMENTVANSSGTFGYDEATRKFNLPPASGSPDFTLFASRSAIDTGVMTTLSEPVTPPGANPSISRNDVAHSPLENQDIGGHLNLPLLALEKSQSSLSGGLDFKTYDISSYKTNFFFITQTNFDANGNPILPPIQSAVPSVVPSTASSVEYLPLSVRYDGNRRDSLGTTAFGLGFSVNTWFDSRYSTTTAGTNGIAHTSSVVGGTAIKNITGSSLSSGNWVVFTPRLARDFVFKGWTTSLVADGQWASEPLIASEQFGAGGVNSVRGYHEGEVFGDSGWHLSLEQQTPPYTVGRFHGGAPLVVRGSVYMGYADVYLIDPQGRQGSTPLWGTGFGFSAAIGSHFQSQFLFSWPLLSAGTVNAYQPFFDFLLTVQF